MAVLAAQPCGYTKNHGIVSFNSVNVQDVNYISITKSLGPNTYLVPHSQWSRVP